MEMGGGGNNKKHTRKTP